MLNKNGKTTHIIEQFLQLRLLVGFLGQRKQAGWWNCNFLDATGIKFLEATFPRTARHAALRSTTDAACSVHDKALGRMGCYHLFRLPPELEDMVEQVYERIEWAAAFTFIETRESALEELNSIADVTVKAPEGPVQVGDAKRILTATAVHEIAAHYHSAFKEKINCYPYFAEGNSAKK